MKGEESREASYWRANLRLLAVLLAIWFAVSFGLGILLVVPLNEIRLGGFPLGFWFSQQGAILVFVVLVLVYALAMDRLERRRPSGQGPDAQGGEGR
ncbi:MAG: DUF4212 domain-containing protein [Myxococcota bacterium]|nr:DUF4212 domain-containing protein [Myxococcota bacterium]